MTVKMQEFLDVGVQQRKIRAIYVKTQSLVPPLV